MLTSPFWIRRIYIYGNITYTSNPNKLKLLTRNARINTDARLLILLGELENITWNFICFSETRRSTEDVIISGGHRLISSNGDGRYIASGVTILVHRNLCSAISCFPAVYPARTATLRSCMFGQTPTQLAMSYLLVLRLATS